MKIPLFIVILAAAAALPPASGEQTAVAGFTLLAQAGPPCPAAPAFGAGFGINQPRPVGLQFVDQLLGRQARCALHRKGSSARVG